ncbi:MAG TPA: LPS export ABC transporter permease LptF [Gammaproteobacteria bacterium]|nr:LPS export ABC transporter permease LptF [Gammaproteobacteria bacterium]
MLIQKIENYRSGRLLNLILDRSITREVTYTGLGATVIIMTIFLVARLVTLLSQAARGDVPADLVLTLLGLRLISTIDVLLPIMFYLAILMVMDRLIRENELSIWAASGVGLMRFLKPLLIMGVVLSSIIAMLALYIAPEADVKAKALKQEGIERAMVTAVSPGVFNEVKNGQAVYYVEDVGIKDNTLRGIFTYGINQQREGVVVADRGFQQIDQATGDRFVVLKDGSRYEGVPGNADYRKIDFETYAIRVKPAEKVSSSVYPKEMPFDELLASTQREHKVEIQWRLSKVAIIPVLAVLALAFSSLDVRRGRMGKMVLAIAMYFLYSNILGFAHALLKTGKLEPWVGLWWVHGLFLVFAWYMLLRREAARSLVPMPSRLRRS